MAVTKTSTKARTGFAHEFDDKIKESKTTLATGGGEPIAKGHKRTTEKRVLQPRDPDTGKFDYNSSAGIERKYDYHADRNGHKYPDGSKGGGKHKQAPWSFKDAIQMFAKKAELKAGSVLVSPSDVRYIASMDITEEEFVERCETISGLNKLSQGMVTKKGRRTKEEAAKKEERDLAREARSYGADVDIDTSWNAKSGGKYGKGTKKELKSALKDYLAGKSSNSFPLDLAQKAADLDPQTLANNQAFNNWLNNVGQKVVSSAMSKHNDRYELNEKDITAELDVFFNEGGENKVGKKSEPTPKAKANIAQAILIALKKKKSSV